VSSSKKRHLPLTLSPEGGGPPEGKGRSGAGSEIGTRWRRRKDARPQEILEAALKVFAEKGFAATRLEEIAARAGVAKGTIYLYFPSKEAVFTALVKEKLGGRVTAFADLAKGHEGPVAPLLASLLRAIGYFIRTSDYVVLPKIVIAEAGNFPHLARMYRDEVILRGMALLGGVIEAGMKRGEFRTLPVEHAVRMCLAPLLFIAVWRTTFDQFDAKPYDYEGLVEDHITTILRGLSAEANP
jgi:AcrR family transcriptional regulator